MEGRTKGSAYKMKGSPMQRNFGIGSPAKKLDVLVDGESIGTGDDAYAAGRIQEIKTKKAVDEAYSSSPGTTDASEAADRDRIASAKTKIKTVSYTGADAYKRIDDSNMSAEEKAKAKAKVRAGGSYTAQIKHRERP